MAPSEKPKFSVMQTVNNKYNKTRAITTRINRLRWEHESVPECL